MTDANVPLAESPTDVVAIDIPCRKCSYNLRGLPASGRCPECGQPVGLSITGDLLRFSDPDWVAKLRKGINLMLTAIVVMVLGLVLLMIIGMVSGTQMTAETQIVGLITNLLGVIGAWLLTEPDPSGLGEREYGTSRKIIRVSLVIGLVNGVISFGPSSTITPAEFRLILALVNIVAAIASVVGTFAELVYLKKLARRIPSDKLERQAHSIMWGFGISYGIVAVFGAIVALAAGANAPPLMIVGGCIVGVAGIVMLVFGLLYISLLVRFGKQFKEQEQIARATWAAAPAPAA